MRPKFESHNPHSSESDLYLLAKKFGFASAIPESNTEAHGRLHDPLLSFARLIESGKGPRVDTSVRYGGEIRGRASPKDIINAYGDSTKYTTAFDNRRRDSHDELCRMIFGTSWENTSPRRREQITELAFQLLESERPPRQEAA